jgi:hypothetical protein
VIDEDVLGSLRDAPIPDSRVDSPSASIKVIDGEADFGFPNGFGPQYLEWAPSDVRLLWSLYYHLDPSSAPLGTWVNGLHDFGEHLFRWLG